MISSPTLTQPLTHSLSHLRAIAGKEGKQFGVSLEPTAFLAHINGLLDSVQDALLTEARAFRCVVVFVCEVHTPLLVGCSTSFGLKEGGVTWGQCARPHAACVPARPLPCQKVPRLACLLSCRPCLLIFLCSPACLCLPSIAGMQTSWMSPATMSSRRPSPRVGLGFRAWVA